MTETKDQGRLEDLIREALLIDLEHHSKQPPQGMWASIDEALQDSSPVPSRFRFRPGYRTVLYAAAALFLFFLGGTGLRHLLEPAGFSGVAEPLYDAVEEEEVHGEALELPPPAEPFHVDEAPLDELPSHVPSEDDSIALLVEALDEDAEENDITAAVLEDEEIHESDEPLPLVTEEEAERGREEPGAPAITGAAVEEASFLREVLAKSSPGDEKKAGPWPDSLADLYTMEEVFRLDWGEEPSFYGATYSSGEAVVILLRPGKEEHTGEAFHLLQVMAAHLPLDLEEGEAVGDYGRFLAEGREGLVWQDDKGDQALLVLEGELSPSELIDMAESLEW